MDLLRALTWFLSLGAVASIEREPYDDATLTLTSVGCPDPFITIFLGQYYLTYTTGNRVEVWSSNSLVDIERSAIRHQVWTPPRDSEHSAELWAPELHAIDGRWYIYYTAADPKVGGKSHRMYVLGGPPAIEHPCSGQWQFLGRVRGMPEQWAIDGTVFEIDNQLYFAYSGWPIDASERYRPEEDDGFLFYGGEYEKQADITDDNSGGHSKRKSPNNGDGQNEHENKITHDVSGMLQQIYLLRLDTPSAADTKPVVISNPTEEWEITRDNNGAHAINEGPEWLTSPDGRWRGLVFSCAASWTNQYKMATLQYIGGPPLDPASWRKSKTPLLQTRRYVRSTNANDIVNSGKGGNHASTSGSTETGTFGPGHGSFVDLGGGSVIAVYHATNGPNDGWFNRLARVQRVTFLKEDGAPYMGQPSGSEISSSDASFITKIMNKLKLGKRAKKNPSGNGKEEQLRAFLENARATRAEMGDADADADADVPTDSSDDEA